MCRRSSTACASCCGPIPSTDCSCSSTRPTHCVHTFNVLNTAELSSEQRLGWGLRALVAEFPGRFDVRFAGFQEIQRTTSSPDGPFFNFRTGETSLPLKVFEPAEAIELLV